MYAICQQVKRYVITMFYISVLLPITFPGLINEAASETYI